MDLVINNMKLMRIDIDCKKLVNIDNYAGECIWCFQYRYCMFLFGRKIKTLYINPETSSMYYSESQSMGSESKESKDSDYLNTSLQDKK